MYMHSAHNDWLKVTPKLCARSGSSRFLGQSRGQTPRRAQPFRNHSDQSIDGSLSPHLLPLLPFKAQKIINACKTNS
ncbi:hypothetical protein VTI28DRAFT_9530 [Corynascus sepedonium]